MKKNEPCNNLCAANRSGTFMAAHELVIRQEIRLRHDCSKKSDSERTMRKRWKGKRKQFLVMDVPNFFSKHFIFLTSITLRN